MKIIVQLIFTLTAGGSSVVLCLLLLRHLLRRGGTIKWQYGIGKIAIAFYLLPIAFFLQWIFSMSVPFLRKPIQIPAGNAEPSGFIHGLSFSISTQFATLFLGIWALGVIIFASWQIYCYRRFIQELESTHMPVPETSEAMHQLVSMKEVLRIKGNVQLRSSELIRSPILIGFRKPMIYLPEVNCVNMDMIIHHELIHLKRKDVWIKAFALAANAVHWFNPLIYILRKDIHVWSELSCDEAVVKNMSKIERKRYAETILSVMIGSKELPVQFCSSLSDEGKQLKRRLDRMLQAKKIKKGAMTLSIIAMVAIGGVGTSAAVWASGKAPEIKDVKLVEKQEKYEEGDQGGEQATEVKLMPSEEANEQQIEKNKIVEEQEKYEEGDQGIQQASEVKLIPSEDANEQQIEKNKLVEEQEEYEEGIYIMEEE